MHRKPSSLPAHFSGPLKEKSEEEQISFLPIWSGDEGREQASMWTLTADEKKKLSTYWAKFEIYVAPRSNFRLARYKLRIMKQEPSETVDSFLKKVRILVKECKYTNPDERIVDALIFGSNNPLVQSKFLEHDDTLTLFKAINIARTQELPATSYRISEAFKLQQSMPWGRIHTQDSPKYRKTKPKMKGVEIVEIFMT